MNNYTEGYPIDSREHFAGLAMQELIRSYARNGHLPDRLMCEEIAKISVVMANLMIKKLDEDQ